MGTDLREEIRRWQQARRATAGLLPFLAASQRIAVDDHEVLVVRRRAPRLSERARSRAGGAAGQ